MTDNNQDRLEKCYQALIEICKDLHKQIEVLTIERDELSKHVDNITKTGYEDVTKTGRILDDIKLIKKLEQERDELKNIGNQCKFCKPFMEQYND